MGEPRDLLRDLPAVDRVLAHPKARALLERFNRQYVLEHCRCVLEELRRAIKLGEPIDAGTLEDAAIVMRLEERIGSGRGPRLQRVVNATGIVLHTNLGRALLAREAIEAVCEAAAQAVNLEYDLDRGERGR